MAEARGNRAAWEARAAGIAPNCGVTDSQERVRWDRRTWEPEDAVGEGAAERK